MLRIGLVLAIVLIVVSGIILFPIFVSAESGATLNIKSSHKSIPEGEKFVLSGILRDRNWNPIGFAEIIIWESDGNKNTHVTKTKTNSNGEYSVTLTAKKMGYR